MFPIALSSKHSVCPAELARAQVPRGSTIFARPLGEPSSAGWQSAPIFSAAIPVLAVMIALFLLRDQDRLLPIDATRGMS